MKKTITIVGAGNGGQAFAAYLSLHDQNVRIFDVFENTISELNRLGGIVLEGRSDIQGFGKINFATTDMEKAVRGADIIMVTQPSNYHRLIMKQMAPYLENGQCVILNPSGSLGTFEIKNELEKHNKKIDILLACTSTLLFACRLKEIGHVFVSGQKKSLSASTHPSSRNREAKELFSEIIPQFDFKDDVLKVSLNNLRALVHPAPCILNTGRIESGTPFEYYLDFTPSQGVVVDAMDKERMEIGKAYGLQLNKLKDEYIMMYGSHGENTYEVLTNCPGYHGIMGPTSLKTRYMYEDIPYSLIAYQTLAKIANIKTPCIDTIITLSYIMIPDMQEGRTIEALGLSGKTKEDIISMCR